MSDDILTSQANSKECTTKALSYNIDSRLSPTCDLQIGRGFEINVAVISNNTWLMTWINKTNRSIVFDNGVASYIPILYAVRNNFLQLCPVMIVHLTKLATGNLIWSRLQNICTFQFQQIQHQWIFCTRDKLIGQ